jgi:hypothetical protein
MQVLNYSPIAISALSQRLQTSITEIVNQIEIVSYYCIKHPNYKTVDLPETVISRFEKLPLEMKNKHLSLQLRNLLYGTYYNGSWKSVSTDEDTTENSAMKQNLANDNLFGIDLEFYHRLHTSNNGVGYWNHDWLVVREETDGSLAIYKNGLTLHVQRDVHLSPADQFATIGNPVSLKMPKNLVQNGFYMAVGNLGSQTHQDIVRIYFNLNPSGVIAVMENLTTQLNAIPITFSFKALYNPADYGRYDSAVLYLNKFQYGVIYSILEKIYMENRANFIDQVPLFTKLLAPGLACAEEPDHRFGEQESFGTHRCQIIANGLIDAWEQGDNSPENRLKCILQHFESQEIDLQFPYLNANSDDIYTPLNN